MLAASLQGYFLIFAADFDGISFRILEVNKSCGDTRNLARYCVEPQDEPGEAGCENEEKNSGRGAHERTGSGTTMRRDEKAKSERGAGQKEGGHLKDAAALLLGEFDAEDCLTLGCNADEALPV